MLMHVTGRIQATSISTPAAALLARRRAQGKVHSVFSRAVNIEIGGKLLTVADTSLLNLPFGLLCDFKQLGVPATLFRRGDPVKVAGSLLQFPRSGVLIDCKDAARWFPSFRLSVNQQGLAAIRARLQGVQGIVFSREDVCSRLAPLLAVVCEPDSVESIKSDGHTTFQQRALEGLALLARGSRQGSADLMFAGALRLVGLGPGLTPSGDDVLAGLLTTLIVAGCGPLRAQALVVSSRVAAKAQRHTTDIAASFLRFASQGYVTERFKNLLMSVIEGSPGLEANTSNMIAFGASSGAETVVGMLVGLELLLERIEQPPQTVRAGYLRPMV